MNAPSRTHDQRNSEILLLKRRGYTDESIALQVGCTVPVVRHAIQHAAQIARARHTDLCSEALMVTDMRLEWLWSEVDRLMTEADPDKGYDPNLIRLGVQIIERRAKLLGLDSGRTQKAGDWLGSPEELERFALENYGIKLPPIPEPMS